MSVRKHTGLLATLAVAAFPAASFAAIVANFDGGNSTTAVDGYVGTAGTGGTWTSAWTKLNGGSTVSIVNDTVQTTGSPTTGGGNFLGATVRSTAAAAAGSGAVVGRTFDNSAAGVPTNAAFTVAFDFRTDVLPASGQSYQIYGNPGIQASGSNNSWVLRATSSGTFQLLSNPTGTAVAAETIAGIAFAANTNYSVLVEIVDPSTRRYRVTVSNGTVTRTSNDAFFRTTATNAGNSVLFGAFTPSGASDYGFSVDSVTVTAVPEPAGLVAAGLVAAGLLRRTRRR